MMLEVRGWKLEEIMLQFTAIETQSPRRMLNIFFSKTAQRTTELKATANGADFFKWTLKVCPSKV